MYNNIVIYIVGHGAEDALSPNEMHIFQCVNVSARDVVEDLKAFKTGMASCASSGTSPLKPS